MERRITATQFKATCLALLDDVERTGGEIVVTKHGRAVARVVPIGDAPDLRGSVTYRVSDEDLLAPTGEVWNAELDRRPRHPGAALVSLEGEITPRVA